MLPNDGPALAEAVAALSARSRYRRFFSAATGLAPSDLARLLDLDGRSRAAAVVLEPASERWVGVARWSVLPDEPGVAEIAVTVTDAWQHRGLGRALLRYIETRTEKLDIWGLEATTLVENGEARTLLRQSGFVPILRSGSTITLRRLLNTRQSSTA